MRPDEDKAFCRHVLQNKHVDSGDDRVDNLFRSLQAAIAGKLTPDSSYDTLNVFHKQLKLSTILSVPLLAPILQTYKPATPVCNSLYNQFKVEVSLLTS